MGVGDGETVDLNAQIGKTAEHGSIDVRESDLAVDIFRGYFPGCPCKERFTQHNLDAGEQSHAQGGCGRKQDGKNPPACASATSAAGAAVTVTAFRHGAF